MLMSAYKQLQPAQRAMVDAIVIELERAADRAGERITASLHRDIPQHLVSRDTRGMLTAPLVQAALVERVQALGAEKELTPAKWLKHAMAVSFSSMGDYVKTQAVWNELTGDYDEIPHFDLTQLTEQQWAAVKSLEFETKANSTKIKMTLHDKLAGLSMMGKYMGMVEPENPHWKADRSAVAQQIAATDTDAQAADRYQALLEG